MVAMALSDEERRDWSILAAQLKADDPTLAQALTDGVLRRHPGTPLLQVAFGFLIALTGAATLLALIIGQSGIGLLTFFAYVLIVYKTSQAPARSQS